MTVDVCDLLQAAQFTGKNRFGHQTDLEFRQVPAVPLAPCMVLGQ